MESANIDFALIIVLFNPDRKEIENVKHLSGAFYGVVVDNSPAPAFQCDTIGKMKYKPLRHNVGIAKAQNEGIEILRKDGKSKYIVFFDQDSEFPDSYPQSIVNEYIRINKLHDDKLSCLGPIIIDKGDGEEYKSAFHKVPAAEKGFVSKSEIISSGSCFSIKRFDEIGMFDERLFIDFVDTEWCFRSEALGYVCGQTTNLKLEHKVGNRKFHLGRHIILLSAPFRYYYQYRNYLQLLFRGYVPKSFKFYRGVKHLLRWFYFPFLHGGFARWKYMNKGILAGFSELIKSK